MTRFRFRAAIAAAFSAALILVNVHPASAQAGPNCRRGYFCTWDQRNYQGTQHDYYFCNDWQVMDFAGLGSYFNNQTGGARATFYDEERRSLGQSLPPGQGDTEYYWGPVFFIDPC